MVIKGPTCLYFDLIAYIQTWDGFHVNARTQTYGHSCRMRGGECTGHWTRPAGVDAQPFTQCLNAHCSGAIAIFKRPIVVMNSAFKALGHLNMAAAFGDWQGLNTGCERRDCRESRQSTSGVNLRTNEQTPTLCITFLRPRLWGEGTKDLL